MKADALPAIESDAAFVERLRIAEVVSTAVVFAELGEWERYARCFADEVTIDYSPSIGDGPQTLSRERMMAFSRASMAAFDATQHQITNVQVERDGDAARTRSYMRATHRIGRDVWVRGGIYVHRLVRGADGRWRIHAQRRISLYEEGDATVYERGADRMREAVPEIGIASSARAAAATSQSTGTSAIPA